jgi:hypothetical protein
MLNEHCYIGAEVGVRGTTSNRHVDFIIRNGHWKWAIEFFINGDKGEQADEHVNRFTTKYLSLSGYDWVVVDFQQGDCAPKEFISFDSDHYMKVYYHLTEMLIFQYVELANTWWDWCNRLSYFKP